jgi:4-oxalocrotonate tautomerase
MPIIDVHILEGKTMDQKRKLVKGITEVCVAELGVKPEQVRIIYSEMKKEDFSLAGKLMCDN